MKIRRTTHVARIVTALAVLAAGLLASDAARAANPDLRDIQPTGGQRGTEITVTLSGQRLTDPLELHSYDLGIEVLELKAVDAKKVEAKLRIAPDAPLGEHRLRLRTKRGWTDLRTLFVGQFAEAAETEPNNDFAAPQPITLNTTVNGVVDNEDVDYFEVEAKKGQRIAVEVEGIRLGRAMFDPYVAILDARRFEIGSADDTTLLQQDAFVSAIAPADGKYIILVRESAYAGSADSHYRLHVGDFPRPTVATPPGGKPGESLKVTLLGDARGPIERTIKLPDEPTDRFAVFAEQDGRTSPSPVWVRVSPLDATDEAEPNNHRKQPTTVAALPAALHGVIDSEGDHDWFQFTAKKGQRITAQVYARSLRSPLDAVLNIFDGASGKHLTGNDDSENQPDSGITYTIPEDGEYLLRVRDHLGRGGAAFVYRIELTTPAPALSFNMPPVQQNDSQTRQFISVPRGNRWLLLLQANRRDFGGELKVIAENLPEGVTMHAPVIAGNVNQAPVIFEATAEAPLSGRLVNLRGRHADESKQIAGSYAQVVDLVQGNPNNTPYYSTMVKPLAVAVCDASPFAVRIVPPKVPLVRSGVIDLKIIADRQEGFDEPITVSLPFTPPGVNTRPTVKIDKGQRETTYRLSANGNAALGEWSIAVQTWAKVDGGDLYVASPHTTLSIAEHFVTGEIQMTVAEVGAEADVIVKLNPTTPFDGEAELALHGLPNKCAVEPVKITADAKEAVFKVTTDEATPPGQHKSLFAQITVLRDGEAMRQSLAGGGVLRIDKPRPKPKPKPDEAKAEKPKPEEREKPLSRLEQLRAEREAEQEAK